MNDLALFRRAGFGGDSGRLDSGSVLMVDVSGTSDRGREGGSDGESFFFLLGVEVLCIGVGAGMDVEEGGRERPDGDGCTMKVVAGGTFASEALETRGGGETESLDGAVGCLMPVGLPGVSLRWKPSSFDADVDLRVIASAGSGDWVNGKAALLTVAAGDGGEWASLAAEGGADMLMTDTKTEGELV